MHLIKTIILMVLLNFPLLSYADCWRLPNGVITSTNSNSSSPVYGAVRVQCPQTQTNLPNCPGGSIFNGVSCVCQNGTAWNGNQCVQQQMQRPNCPGGSVHNGSSCVCQNSTSWDGNQCVNRQTQQQNCPGGSVFNGSSCICQNGTTWDGSQCTHRQVQQQNCPGGSVFNGSGCSCPQGAQWNGQQCTLTPKSSVTTPLQNSGQVSESTLPRIQNEVVDRNAFDLLLHYLTGDGIPVRTPLNGISFDTPNWKSFPGLDQIFRGSCSNREQNIDSELSISATGLDYLGYGNITLRLRGVYKETGRNFVFRGRLTANPDYWNLNKSTHRKQWAEILTRVGSKIPGDNFQVQIVGTSRVQLTGQCIPPGLT